MLQDATSKHIFVTNIKLIRSKERVEELKDEYAIFSFNNTFDTIAILRSFPVMLK